MMAAWSRGNRLASWLAMVAVVPMVVTSPVALAQQVPVPQVTGAPQLPANVTNLPGSAIGAGIVRAVTVTGAERIEADTVRSYVQLAPGDRYDSKLVDDALKRLYATELFADVTIRVDNDILTVNVRENPVINRVILEGNKRLKDDKINPEIRLAPRQIYTRSKVRSDVNRIIEVYRRSGRFAATVDPKIILLEQNRVDLVYEITEGPKSFVRKINIIGNERFSSGDLRDEMATREARWWRLFTSNDTYDPDRLAFDREKMRQFYLTNGYADFRVVSQVSELTPDRKDFLVTYTIEEGERYRIGTVDLESKIRDLDPKTYKPLIKFKEGDWYDAKKVEDTVETLTETAGLFGYAFADIRPRIQRDKEKRTMSITFQINEAPRVYVERIDINGNVGTEDKVIRREFRLAEGDAFNSFKVKRSKDRIQSLGFFQEKLEVEQKPGSTPDKVVLEVNVEEKATGELNLGAGFSSLERFILDFSIRQRNFMGKGQDLRLGFTLSSYRNEIDLGFTEPYLFGRNLAAGIDIFRRDLNSFRFTGAGGNDRETTYSEISTGFGLRAGFPLTEYWSMGTRYNLSITDITLADQFYTNTNGVAGIQPDSDRCDASVFICSAVGKRTTSSLGYSLVYDSLNNRIRPSAGQRFTVSQDIAGLGGSDKYLRNRVDYDIYFPLWEKWVLRFGAEAGHIMGVGEDVRLYNRFFLGGPRIRGFQIRGIGPRDKSTKDAIGGNIYYLGGAELEVPLGSAASELGLRASAFVDVGSLWKVNLESRFGESPANIEGNSARPRVSVGVGVAWNSPFGPFRIDLGKALAKQTGDETEFFQFNIGTQF
jgi:outer membrane protein insertion porin family